MPPSESPGDEEKPDISGTMLENINSGGPTTEQVAKVDPYNEDEQHIKLTWRSWMVILVNCFAIMSQIFVVAAAGSVVGFIARDLGDAEISGWVIQAPLLVQSVFCPIIGRLSDIVDRKNLAMWPNLIALAGAVVSAKADKMTTLIGGGVLLGVNISTISIVQAIPSEILPMKYRALANGFAFIGGAVGALVGSLGAGAATNADPSGWRTIFWIEAGFFGASFFGILFFYWPPKQYRPALSLSEIIWACDPIGCVIFTISVTLCLMSLNWAGGSYPWHDAHVAVPLSIGLFAFVLFALYEWKGRTDGLVAHVFFKRNYNFALSVFAFTVEGWVYFSAVNSVTPLMILNLGFEDNALDIAVRQLALTATCLVASLPLMWWATKYKDLKNPLLLTFGLFLVSVICFCNINPRLNHAQIVFTVIGGVGQAGPLTLITALIQFTAPHAYLSTATGLAFSARAIGGAFGSAILNTIIDGHISSHYASSISATALDNGLNASALPNLFAALAAPQLGFANVTGLTPTILEEVMDTSHKVYGKAYRKAWGSIVPFVVLGILSIWFLKGVKELMTEYVEAPVEVDFRHHVEAPIESPAVSNHAPSP